MKDLEFLRQVEIGLINIIKIFDPNMNNKCHTISNMIASYFNTHFESNLFHYSDQGRHGWVANTIFAFEYRDSEQRIITDPKKLKHRNSYYKMKLLAIESAKKVANPKEVKSFLNWFQNNFKEIDKACINVGMYSETRWHECILSE
ncbi:hypothetical protein EDM57_04835 [Brevibacillus gelatini]|uniref:Uncharacterized protein n=1 Tax=Brevibacillus gelatini TaxID=1655277 RepID=A0A3M8B7Y2_9BACL|nr:hypothetical protein [Brevibacillus gelatini]RNB59470.1 hypothetical protein EDM57_04835 [Brevibacillus gelatini]